MTRILEESTWLSSDYLDNDSPRQRGVPQFDIDWNCWHGSELATVLWRLLATSDRTHFCNESQKWCRRQRRRRVRLWHLAACLTLWLIAVTLLPRPSCCLLPLVTHLHAMLLTAKDPDTITAAWRGDCSRWTEGISVAWRKRRRSWQQYWWSNLTTSWRSAVSDYIPCSVQRNALWLTRSVRSSCLSICLSVTASDWCDWHILTDFLNSSAVGLSNKYAAKSLLYFPPHFKCVTKIDLHVAKVVPETWLACFLTRCTKQVYGFSQCHCYFVDIRTDVVLAVCCRPCFVNIYKM